MEERIPKIWRAGAPDEKAAAKLASDLGISDLAARVLTVRGADPAAPFGSLALSDPFGIPDMGIAARLVNEALDAGEKIAVFGDYDADGVCAASLMVSWLRSRGASAVVRLPDRFSEGYGLGAAAVRELADAGTKLLITVDCGVSCPDEIALAKSLGMKTVVTDHHICPGILPGADAVVDPHRPDSKAGFFDICGCVVALKLVCAAEILRGVPDALRIYTRKYCDLAALATAADVMPLMGENRLIVKLGTEKLKTDPVPGLAALLEAAGVKKIDSTALSFYLAPRINAAGRMAHPSLAAELIGCEDPEECATLAEQLNGLNSRRRTLESEVCDEAIEQLSRKLRERPVPLLFAAGEGWHPGVIGIAASRICEKSGFPTFLVSISENGEGRGSCRAPHGFDVTSALSECSDILIKFGGHAAAAGFSVRAEDLPLLEKRLCDIAVRRGVDRVRAGVDCDCRLRAEDLTYAAASSLEALEPFGEGNPRPFFMLEDALISGCFALSEGKHTRLLVSKDGAPLTALCFGMAFGAFPFKRGDRVDLAGYLEAREYGSERGAALNVKNIRTHTQGGAGVDG